MELKPVLCGGLLLLTLGGIATFAIVRRNRTH